MDASAASKRSSVSASSITSHSPPDQAAQAAQSLQLLLREDPLLQQFGLTETTTSDTTAFPYAAALLEDDTNGTSTKQRAAAALQEVERKLALVESLAVKLSRTSPEAVAGHLLRLHGHDDSSNSRSMTLLSIRERSDRLARQADTLDTIAQRVQQSLERGLGRMETACCRLERVLLTSQTLKQTLRLVFETRKLRDYDLDDLRDLTRAAASVAIVEDLLKDKNDLKDIAVVKALLPAAQATAKAVRHAAADLLLQQQQQQQQQEPNSHTTLTQLGATLQVYYHLGELPDAVYQAVDQAHDQAAAVCRQLWNANTLAQLQDQAKKTARESRLIPKRLKELRAQAAQTWATNLLQVSQHVRNLQRVLAKKTDPHTRQAFCDVVAAAPIPAAYRNDKNIKDVVLTRLYWHRLGRTLGGILDESLRLDGGQWTADVAALYPFVRAAALEALGNTLQETIPVEGDVMEGSSGILGGSSLLGDAFLGQVLQPDEEQEGEASMDNPQSADVWTRPSVPTQTSNNNTQRPASTSTLSSVFGSMEWQALQGSKSHPSGLYPLQQAFLQACRERLHSPLQYLFPENVHLDEDGVAMSHGLSLLPSKYDINRFDETIRAELSLADPREGGGDLTAVTMLCQCVVSMIADFCVRAKNAMSGISETGMLLDDWSMTESLQHDRKVAAIMYTVAKNLRNAPEKTFVAPYRPATTPQHEEAANMCSKALAPAQQDIEKVVKATVIFPLCRALNRRIAAVLARMHLGVYRESSAGGDLEDVSPAFVQKYLASVFETIAEQHVSKFPPEYASVLVSRVAAFTIYTFVSNASLVRPLGESARLHITQDLADLEMALEQFVAKGGLSLSQIDNGKPYAELRAVRQLLFWTGLENQDKLAQDIAKSMFREVWMKDVRPSTVFHYLFSYAPSLLSSPHHAKRLKAEEYVATLVQYDGSVEDGEDTSWMTTMSCCDSYQQRASSSGGAAADDGDARVAQILLTLGPELMRRRRN